ncbi:hypothetical protein M011DRAFT_453771 [Sporormia fimetaria CBS 119925]|uniref:Pentacotripeptide-repeat region of PRORP domain-containing protein n=1 Tax=Sporormia fimetaria CBS 119925 TaxID=1340428 RepID=A0A6A6UX61_9PLEO|nr:hypothetical protein M011DRAFT_453771 [Sporormia fimetaria CBS 119925]
MLERASTCLEIGGRTLLRAPKPCLRSRRALHSAFWHHGASDLCLPIPWATVVADQPYDSTPAGTLDPSPSDNREPDLQLLDFLYPEKTLALIRQISSYGLGTMPRRRHRLHGAIRPFSTSRTEQRQVVADTQQLDAEEEALIARSAPDKQELAWRLLLAIPDSDRTSALQVDLLDYLVSGNAAPDPGRILAIFEALPESARRATSYRAAVCACADLNMVGRAVQLYEEAIARDFGLDLGTDVVLASAVREHSWDMTIRVIGAFSSLASRNGFNLSHLYQDPSRQKDDFKVVWGGVSQIPGLEDQLESLLHFLRRSKDALGVEKEQQEGSLHLSLGRDGGPGFDKQRKEAIDHLILGLAAEATEQVLNVPKPDESQIREFLADLFRTLRELEIPNGPLYEYVIRRMLHFARYRTFSNQRKPWLTLYRWYRDDCEGKRVSGRPSQKLLRELLVQVGVHRSSKMVDNIIKDFRLFYPNECMPYAMLKFVIDYYAESGQVNEVQEYVEEFRKGHGRQLDTKVLTALPYSHARRINVQGAEQQFERISTEFGMTPDTACWNVLLLAYTRADDLDGALACFNRMLAAGAMPDVYTFGPLLDLCAARGDIEAYETLYAKAEQIKIPIRTDVRARAGFVQALLNFDDPEGAEATAQAMLRQYRDGMLEGSLTHTWNLLIQYYALRGDVDSSRRLYREMLDNGIPLDTWTYSSLMRALVEVKQTNAAFKILRVTMPGNNIRVYAFHYAICIVGFLRERQYDLALIANKMMLDRDVPQTATSRMASLQAIGLAELRALSKKRTKDPRQRLEALEQKMREIILSDYEKDVANREPSHNRLIDSKQQLAPEGYFGFLILLYGARRSFDICKELFQAATARDDDAKYEAPITLLTAIMETHLRLKEYDEVDKCWKLARSQAGKLVKTLEQAFNPEPASDGSVEGEIPENNKIRIAKNRRQVLFRTARIYMQSLFRRGGQDSLLEAQDTLRDLLAHGFVVDNVTWNEFIQVLCQRHRVLDAFTACESYLMPEFPGWRYLNAAYIRKERRGHEWFALRHTDLSKRSRLPRYKTLVVLASAWSRIRRDEYVGVGYNEEMRAWPSDILRKVSPMTVEAIETMPRTEDTVQRKYLDSGR